MKAAAKIHTMGPKYVVIKKGEHGALIFHEKEIFFAPALPLADVFDPTGAGDTFAGGFAGFITQQGNVSFETMKTAIIQGSNLASFCVEKFGTERMLELKEKEVMTSMASLTCSLKTLEDYERFAILKTGNRCNWNITVMAKELEIGRNTLYNKMKSMGIN